MTATPAEPATLPTPAAPASPEPSTAVTTPPATPAGEPAQPDPTTPAAPAAAPWDDPLAAKAEIERLRRENGSARTNAKAQAAEEARNELAASISKILNPEAAEVLDPAKLTESLTTAQADAKKAQVALAVYQNAGTVGDPIALLDSTTFLTSVADIDPTDATAVQAAIAKAVEINPRLGAAPATPADPRVPAPNPAQGSSASGAPDLDTQIAAAQKAGDTRLAIHLQNQKLPSAG